MPGTDSANQEFPCVTIITPSYNQARFLETTIQSVLAQGYPNLEYIVIDGGSTDGSVEVIRRYADQLAYWQSCPDGGQAEAINQGFSRATGKYVAWLNSDDVYLPDCIQKAIAVLEANPGAGMVFGQVEVIDSLGKPISLFRPIDYRFDDLLTYQIILPQQAAFFRRAVVAEVGPLNPQFHYALDHEFFIRIGERFPILGNPEVLAQYRISLINKGTTQRSKWAVEYVKILDLFFKSPPQRQKFHKLIPLAYYGAYYNGACGLLDDGLYALSRQWFLTSLRCFPRAFFKPRWWIHFIRTFLGNHGNRQYLNLKVWLAKKGLLDIRYDWWTGLKIASEKE